MYLKYIQCAKTCKNMQKRAKTCKNVQKRAKTCKNVHLKYLFIKKRAPQGLIYQKTCKNVQKRVSQMFLDPFQKRALSRSVHLEAVYLEALLYWFFPYTGLEPDLYGKSVLYLLYKFIAILRIESAGLCPRIFVPSSKKKCTKSLSVNFLT